MSTDETGAQEKTFIVLCSPGVGGQCSVGERTSRRGFPASRADGGIARPPHEGTSGRPMCGSPRESHRECSTSQVCIPLKFPTNN